LTQFRAETPEIIYQILKADAQFMALVGTYTFAKGSTEIEALSIITPGAPLEPLQSASGLEVLIHDVSIKRRLPLITRSAASIKTWRVYLLAWPGADGATLEAASDRCLALFSDASVVDTASTPRGVSAAAQVLVQIPSTSVCGTDISAIPPAQSEIEPLAPT
jgi:hypothetical protein